MISNFCTKCGSAVENGVSFCTSCGSQVHNVQGASGGGGAGAGVSPQGALGISGHGKAAPPGHGGTAPPQGTYASAGSAHYQYAAAAPAFSAPAGAAFPAGEGAPGPGSKYEVISTGGYIGIMLLMAVPVVGLIFALVWAFGGCRKVNKRNLARAALVFMVIALILSAVFYFAFDALMKKSGLYELTDQLNMLELLDDTGRLNEL